VSVLHVDLDAFFAAVEVLDDPSLRGKAVIVGGAGARGVVAACTYEARRYGVRSAMPSLRARSLCPHAVFLPGRYARYEEMSRRFHGVLAGFTPLVEGIALDEAFLDVAGAQRLFGPAPAIAGRIRAAIANELGLQASVGVASTKFVAKLASEAAKPRASRQGVTPGAGVVVVESGEELRFLHPLPVAALWGVGPATLARLERFGVATIGQLAAIPVDTLVATLGPSAGAHLHDLAWGRDPRPVEPARAVKSISHEQTYPYDLFDRGDVEREAVRLADGVASRLRRSGLAGRTVTVKVRYQDFATITRSETVTPAVDTGVAIARAAQALLAAVDLSPGVRLLGVGVSNLGEPPPRQLSLDLADAEGAPAGPWGRAAGAVDRIRARYGESAVGPAALLDPDEPGGTGGLRTVRRGVAPWGPASSGGAPPGR
jgi:DNA polymerase IV